MKATRKIAGAILSLEKRLGDVPPWIGVRLYMARVDPHLIYGCEVVLDENPNLVTELEEVQLTTLRRILQTSNCSMIAPLFSETGILPIRYRREQLAL